LTDLFREVEEDLRRERLKQLWDKYGVYVAGLALGIVLAASIIVGWQAWQRSRSETASTRYEELVAQAAKETPAEAAVTLGKFAESAPAGYAALARLRQAAALVEAGDAKEAAKVYDEIAASSGAAPILRGMATIKGSLILLDTLGYDEMKTRLAPLKAADSPWRASAHEISGLSAYKAGKYAEAQADFDAIVNDPGASAGLRDRAHVMQALIAPLLPAAKAADEGKTTDAAPAGARAE
jgi:hypothetical protein